MNVFEDLIVELQEENLLEDTVVGRHDLGGADSFYPSNGLVAPNFQETAVNFDVMLDAPVSSKNAVRPVPKASNGKGRLSEQLSTLQLIEFVISAAEKTSGIKSKHFDDLPVKKAFHRYGQAGSEPDTDEYFEAESTLVSTLSDWQDDLAKRDAAIQPSAVRSYAETANPPLSPQALFALILFYRSVPESGSTYSKFDFVVTRLFSKFVDGERREVLCPRQDIIKHLTQKYAAWGLEGFQSLPADDPEIVSIVSGFDNFKSEAIRASNFMELISSNFFERLLEFKRTSGPMMFVPHVTAALIEANLGISSRVISLITAENEKGGLAQLQGINRSVISDSIARSFSIGTASQSEQFVPVSSVSKKPETTTQQKTQRTESVKKVNVKSRASSGGRSMFGVNRWLLIATVLAVITSVGIYVWAQYFTADAPPSSAVKLAEIDNPEIKPFIKTAKISSSILYAVVTPGFEEMKQGEQRTMAQKLQLLGAQKGYDRVTIMNGQGKTIAYATKDRVEFREH